VSSNRGAVLALRRARARSERSGTIRLTAVALSATAVAFCAGAAAISAGAPASKQWRVQNIPLRGAEFSNAGPTGGAISTPRGVFMSYGGSLYRVSITAPPKRYGPFAAHCPGGTAYASGSFWCGAFGYVARYDGTAERRFRIADPSATVVIAAAGGGLAFAANARVGTIRGDAVGGQQQRCVDTPGALVVSRATTWLGGPHAIAVLRAGAVTTCSAHRTEGAQFIASPGLAPIGVDAVLAVYPGEKAAQIVTGGGDAHVVELPFPATGSVVWDGHRAVAWLTVMTGWDRDRNSSIFELCAVRLHGELLCFERSFSAGGPLMIDGRNRLWMSGGYLHSFAVVDPGDGLLR
jgi:hypothetical protein